jgi:hypothetical protein
VLALAVAAPAPAQISRDARFEIIRTVLADQAASRIAMPFGTGGVELTDAGEVNNPKLESEIKKNGQSIEVGKVVTVTQISFDDNRIELELDGGGKNKKSFFDRLEVGMGGQTTPVSRDDPKKAKGSKVVLKFEGKVPAELTPDQLKELLSPVLDFNKRNFLTTGLESLPPEFQEAVKAKEAMIGMDRNTVVMAMGRPSNKVREKKDGIETEDWIYILRGLRTVFVTFENDVVVRIKQFDP